MKYKILKVSLFTIIIALFAFFWPGKSESYVLPLASFNSGDTSRCSLDLGLEYASILSSLGILLDWNGSGDSGQGSLAAWYLLDQPAGANAFINGGSCGDQGFNIACYSGNGEIGGYYIVTNGCGSGNSVLIARNCYCDIDSNTQPCGVPYPDNCGEYTCTGTNCPPPCTTNCNNAICQDICLGIPCDDGCGGTSCTGQKDCSCVPTNLGCGANICTGDPPCWNGCVYEAGTKDCSSCIPNWTSYICSYTDASCSTCNTPVIKAARCCRQDLNGCESDQCDLSQCPGCIDIVDPCTCPDGGSGGVYWKEVVP
jgi:hypothetical protein